ncbi:MAG: class I SAM-dependent methyltransferase [Nitrospinaceae bacterium]|jgi:ubiquinone/menaquinone biosynthesis C-methylase UbiE|nr:class I SAM-dependent methyltransferase [Nitrospinaceae bacterium]MBT3435964.1 class I SAM-dependent methyltransferase [Nitrospinaceae bacterium]MBT3822194.1 class I SAM-dependent methyltransferase [Nitrospinaceae bacterium]MBT4092888.1 class I SAM-dependent methyltransferase [Nitrospinaceae bacterium]MBT4429972.1 class I SAM-dependent methyltransferase [Nitrospinaceae bacterium]
MSALKVPVEKIVYSKEPENSIEYTKKIDKAYSKYARTYDVAVKLLPVWKTWIKTVIPYIEGKRVLEASFGTGYLLMHYAKNYETYGIDFNANMVEVAQKNLSRKGIKATLQQANAEKLPFPENYFDTIVNTMAFTGYPNGKQAMSEFYRVMKDGGKLIIVDFDYPSDRNVFGYWLTKLMESAGDTIRDIPKILQEFPFEYTEEEIGGFGSVHLYVARKLASA